MIVNKIMTIIAIDFDGTCVTHEYPRIGKEIGASYILRALVDNGCCLVLNTMRSGKELAEAKEWFDEHNIPLYGLNATPGQTSWTQSPKVYAHLYIDDAGIGCPLIEPYRGLGRPFVDWLAMINLLKAKQLLPHDFELSPDDDMAMRQEIMKTHETT